MPSFLWFFNPVIRNVWNSIPPSGCIVWLWTSFDHCFINLTLTAAIYNCTSFPSIMGPSALEKERGGGETSAAQGKFKRMWCLVKTWRGNEQGERESLKTANQSLVMNKALLLLWASVTWHVLQGRGVNNSLWSHRPPGRPQHCFVLQICSPTESDLTGRFSPELFKQKPCVMERENLVILAQGSQHWGPWWVLGLLINRQASKQRQSQTEQVKKTPRPYSPLM